MASKGEIKSIIMEIFNESGFKKIIKEVIEQQTQHIVQLISSNHTIENQKIDKLSAKVDEYNKNIKQELSDLKESIEFTHSYAETEAKKQNEKIKELRETINYLQNDVVSKNEIELLRDRVAQQEDRNKRNNLVINGMVEDKDETWEQCEKKVLKLFDETLGVQNIKIDRAHRVGRWKPNANRTIVLRLHNWKDKQRVFQRVNRLKGKKIYVNEDFSPETNAIRKKLWEDVKKYRSEDKYARLTYRSIIVRDRDN